MVGREDFNAATKRTLAARAGYTCSFRGCQKLTSGPCVAIADKSVNIGEACHIVAAADKGPRADKNVSAEDKKSISNGIWMCKIHAKIIDSADGIDYPAQTLREWKAAHEAHISTTLTMTATFAEGVDSVTSKGFGPLQLDESFQSKIICVQNGNCSGGTTLCELIDAFYNRSYNNVEWRWNQPRSAINAEIKVHCSTLNQKSTLQLYWTKNDGFKLLRNSVEQLSSNPPLLNVLFINCAPNMSDGFSFEKFAQQFQLQEGEFGQIITRVNRSQKFEILSIMVKEKNLFVKFAYHAQFLTFEELCGGEQIRVNLAIAIEVMKEKSTGIPLLLIDDYYDDYYLPLAEFCSAISGAVWQTVIIIGNRRDDGEVALLAENPCIKIIKLQKP